MRPVPRGSTSRIGIEVQPPPGFIGGGGRVLRARWGRDTACPLRAGKPAAGTAI